MARSVQPDSDEEGGGYFQARHRAAKELRLQRRMAIRSGVQQRVGLLPNSESRSKVKDEKGPWHVFDSADDTVAGNAQVKREKPPTPNRMSGPDPTDVGEAIRSATSRQINDWLLLREDKGAGLLRLIAGEEKEAEPEDSAFEEARAGLRRQIDEEPGADDRNMQRSSGSGSPPTAEKGALKGKGAAKGVDKGAGKSAGKGKSAHKGKGKKKESQVPWSQAPPGKDPMALDTKESQYLAYGKPPTSAYFAVRKDFWKEQFQMLYRAVNLDRRVELDCNDEDLPLAFVKLSRMHDRAYNVMEGQILPSRLAEYLPVAKREIVRAAGRYHQEVKFDT